MDDLANNWGTKFCLPDNGHPSLRRPSLPRALGEAGSSSSTMLSGLVSAETDQFTFERVSVCGSQANIWAIDDATTQNASLCLYAAGSYICGDGSALERFSTSKFNVGAELSIIMHPNSVRDARIRTHTIPLPYHIPGVLNPKELMDYEDKCLQAVHIRLCWAKMRRTPYKALFLELMLAGTGAVLSNRALVSLGRLARHHNLCVIVDEIMTGGRTGSMFYLLSKPQSFQAVVTHITLGKWSQMGLVFLSKSWAKKRMTMYPFKLRGASTYLVEDEALVQWRCVKKCLPEIPKKRKNVLDKLRLKEEDVWGEGLLLFGPRRMDTLRGLKCRYLPLIHKDTPIDSIKSTLPMEPKAWRSHVNNEVMTANKLWISDVPQPEVDPTDSTPMERKLDAERLRDFVIVAKLIKESKELDEKQAEDWKECCMPKGLNRNDSEGALGRMQVAGYMKQTQVGRKRQRNWKLQDGVIAPWKSED